MIKIEAEIPWRLVSSMDQASTLDPTIPTMQLGSFFY